MTSSSFFSVSTAGADSDLAVFASVVGAPDSVAVASAAGAGAGAGAASEGCATSGACAGVSSAMLLSKACDTRLSICRLLEDDVEKEAAEMVSVLECRDGVDVELGECRAETNKTRQRQKKSY